MGMRGLLEGETIHYNGVLCLFTIRFAGLAVSITKIMTIPLFFNHDFRVLEHALGVWTWDGLILHLGRFREALLSGVHSFTAY